MAGGSFGFDLSAAYVRMARRRIANAQSATLAETPEAEKNGRAKRS